MKKDILTLDKMPIGSKCTVISLNASGPIHRRFLDLGLIAGTKIEVLQRSPSGDPVAYFIRGAVIALRSEDASKILVQSV